MRFILFGMIFYIILGCASSSGYQTKGVSKEPLHQKFGTAKTKESKKKQGNSLYMVTSYYGKKFHGRKTSNGDVFDMYKLTAAHRFLPFNTIIEVTNLANNRSVRVRVNDRGPFVGNRILDLSYAAARKIGLTGAGVGKVQIRIIRLGEK